MYPEQTSPCSHTYIGSNKKLLQLQQRHFAEVSFGGTSWSARHTIHTSGCTSSIESSQTTPKMPFSWANACSSPSGLPRPSLCRHVDQDSVQTGLQEVCLMCPILPASLELCCFIMETLKVTPAGTADPTRVSWLFEKVCVFDVSNCSRSTFNKALARAFGPLLPMGPLELQRYAAPQCAPPVKFLRAFSSTYKG